MSGAPPRIAVSNLGDPEDPAGFSGAPASIVAALRELGVDVVALRGRLPAGRDRLLMRSLTAARLRPRDLRDLRAAAARQHPVAQLSDTMAVARRRHLAAQAQAARPLDGAIQLGTEYELPAWLPRVTFEDTTILQAWRAWPWPHLQGARQRDIDRFARRAARSYAAAGASLAMSHWAAGSLVEDFGLAPERVHVAGIGANHVVPAPADRDWSVPRFLFVGFDWERKNGPRVVRGLAAVRERHPGATLDVVGGHPPLDVPGVTGHGRLSLADAGDRERLAALFTQATCFVMPSLHEPTGTVHAEAAAAGLASIGTLDGGVGTVIGEAGRLVDPRDDGAVAAAMVELADPGTARALGAAALERSALFTWPKVAQRLLRALAPSVATIDPDGLAEFL